MTIRAGMRLAAGLLCAAALLAGPEPTAAQSGGAVAIVVHPSVPVAELSFSELRRIFLGEQQFWRDNSRITLLMRAPVSYEREFVLDRIYRMTEGQFRQYWIAKLFRAEVATGPKIVYSTDMALELVSAIPGAITFMPAAAVGRGVKVVRIDGKLPTESGYPLK